MNRFIVSGRQALCAFLLGFFVTHAFAQTTAANSTVSLVVVGDIML